ncbi:MarR family winged helix-turn-helix transcriptional regulator [Tractidigestivibacter sp.]|uniref:MarR family winged helix-turn-helix transcriptional regulator n=1 Tax=Tractidigestivibacter sp. TaxID=2847320 RepID=UPI002A839553|nr:MarR family transcriptional regulator [Tractidigestivibacter sp.]MCI6273891.1 MarR family transcriptional regulator [Coriobacteriaceae bacterium]MDD7583890.1 MarR family transcriptional regulator [Coriobacteriaceae bacterium]MDY4533813.1 MarR family transcriptional regulator [Tractidigestivibacter sp.]MDY5272277.1 MarR family transcriptional regulator [Tractidigestivibacter sp.]
MTSETQQPGRCRPPKEHGTSVESRIMRDLGYFGHFLHLHAGGRSGKQHMLERILNEGGTVGQRELQDTVPISSAAVSEVLAKLEDGGLITRTRSECDKRQLDVTLTADGWVEARVCAERRAKFETEALSVLTEDERVRLLDMLDRLIGHWHQIEESERVMQQ